MAKLNLRETAAKLKANWNHPKEGEYLSIKEFVFFGLGGMGLFTTGDVIAMLGFAGTSVVVGKIYGISIQDAYVIGIIGTILGFLLIPLRALIKDNLGVLPAKLMRTIHLVSAALLVVSGVLWVLPSAGLDGFLRDSYKHIAIKIVSTILETYITIYVLKFFGKKYGKFKPFMVFFGLPTLIFGTLFTFLPYRDMDYSTKLIWTHLITNLVFMFNGPYSGNVDNMKSLLTPNSEERTKVFSIAPIMLGLGRSIFGIFFPIVATFSGGQLNIASYRIAIPLIGGFGMLQGFLILKAKERIIQSKDHEAKVSFKDSLKEVFTSKYLWITNISGIFGDIAGMQDGLFSMIMLYGTRMEWMMGLLLNISYLPTTPANLLTPMITRRFSKRQALIGLRLIQTIMKACYIFVIFIPGAFGKVALLMTLGMLQSLAGPPVSNIQGTMGPDIWDYHQWKCGERLEASTGLFEYFSTPAKMLIGFIGPFVLRLSGLVSDWDILFDPTILNRIVVVHVVFAVIGMLLATLPYLFYDLTPDKMKKIAADLKERAGEVDETGEGEDVLLEETVEVAAAEGNEV